MANGPQRLILIQSGRYDYAEIELRGSLQIVGPNNTGKTTLINTLQFLYVDDRRFMEFGSYTLEETWDYYFPNQYSYVLFEVLGSQGQCVMGLRGQSRVIGSEPERFVFDGPFDREDFLNENREVREPKDVSSRLSLKGYRVLKTAQEHREFLLLTTKGEARGAGLVILRENDRYGHFRETLKNLLSLSTISQDEMRRQLLMLASFSGERQALNIREVFGDDYDRILGRKQKLKLFKEQKEVIEGLLEANVSLQARRQELASRWRDLRLKRQTLEQANNKKIQKLTTDISDAGADIKRLESSIEHHRTLGQGLAEQKGSMSEKLTILSAQSKEFVGFAEDFARTALANLQGEIQQLQAALLAAEGETRDKAVERERQSRDALTRLSHLITHFDQALIEVLRRELEEAQLDGLGRLFNFDLLEQTVGDGGASIKSAAKLTEVLRLIANRISDGAYDDETISLPLPAARRSLSELKTVSSLRERLKEEEGYLQKWVGVLNAIEQREALKKQLDIKRREVEGEKDAEGREVKQGLVKQLFRFEEFQKAREGEPELKKKFKQICDDISATGSTIDALNQKLQEARDREYSAKTDLKTQQDDFKTQVEVFGKCCPPDISSHGEMAESNFSDDFAICVQQYVNIQQEVRDLNSEIKSTLQRLELALGPDYAGSDEFETIHCLREELEALPAREDVLRRDWQHQLTGLQATFDQILTSLGDIKSAADQLNRAFSTIQISNLSSLKMSVLEQTETVGAMRRLAKIEQPGLFDDSTGLEATISTFRSRFEATPVLRYQDLFTLRFTVTGDDGKVHHYQDFRQVESDGTTIAIKVLFNLLVLRSLLREDSHRDLLSEIPFFLDEIYSLDNVNRHAILTTSRKLGFIAITAAPESVSEVDALYFLQPQKGRIVVKNSHRIASIRARQRGA